QSAGVNYFIFAILLVVFQLVLQPQLVKNKTWWMAAAGLLSSGTGLLLYGNLLSEICFMLSLLAVAFTSFSPQSSFFAGLFYSMCSFVSSWVEIFIEKTLPADASEKKKTSLWVWIIPVVLVLIFFFLYRESNPVFHEFTKNFNLDFITPGWVFFTLFGWIWLRGFFKFPPFLDSFKSEISLPDNFTASTPQKSIFNYWLSTDNEFTAGTISFILLNIVLLSVNVIDTVYVAAGTQLPAGISHSEFVHQGINALIASLVFAILLVLYFFRGRMYDHPKFKTITTLAMLWIVQNIVMVYFNAVKNYNYIDAHGLTYKRIGVFVYLLLTTIGLVIAAYKVYNRKTNWFLFRKTGWSFYFVMVISVFFNWNMIITNFNIEKWKAGHEIDVHYLYQLGDSNLPALVKNGLVLADYGESEYLSSNLVYSENLNERIDNFLKNRKYQSDWRSWNFEDQRVYNELKQLHNEGYLMDSDENYFN
ncbi:MAG: DUF4173 domain-containing protein, partial [Bacteroidota bacterium]